MVLSKDYEMKLLKELKVIKHVLYELYLNQHPNRDKPTDLSDLKIFEEVVSDELEEEQ